MSFMVGTKDFMYKKEDAGSKELFSMMIYRPIANFLLNNIFKYTKITPNQISFMSLMVVITGCWFFAFRGYPYLLIGLFFLHLGYTLDMLDGQYARYRGLSSRYGRWFDSFVDVIKVFSLFMSLTYGAYSISGNPHIFLWGMLAMAQGFMTYYVLNTRSLLAEGCKFEVKVSKGIYVGYEISLYLTITFFVIIDKVYLGLIFLGTVGALSWIKAFISFNRYYKKHKTEIEGRINVQR